MKLSAFPAWLFGAAALFAATTQSPPGPATAHVRFVDEQGRVVTDLRPDEIQILDGGTEQRIVSVLGPDEPFSIGLLVDVSPSLETYVPILREETRNFFYSLGEDDPMLILTFDDDVYVDADWTTDRKKIDEAIYEFGLHKPGSHSILYDALGMALDQKFADRGPRRILIVFADGWENGSDASDDESIQKVREAGVLTAVVQFDARQHYRKIYYAGVRYDPTRDPLPSPTPGTRIGGILVGGGSEIDQAEYKVQHGHDRATGYLLRLANAGRRRLEALDLSGANLGSIYERLLRDLDGVYTVTFDPHQEFPADRLRALTFETTRAGVLARPVAQGYWP